MNPRANEIIKEVTPLLKENYSTILTVCKLVWKEAEEMKASYSAEEVEIIDMAQSIYFDIFNSNDYPLHISYKPQGESKRKFPAYQLEEKKLVFQHERLGRNEIAPLLECVITDLITYYNASKDALLAGNSKAIKYIFLYLIDIAYILSKIDLTTTDALKEIDKHLLYVKRLMSMEALEKNFLGNDHTNANKTLAKVFMTLSKQCKPRVLELSNRLDAGTHLGNLSALIERLCSSSFDIAIHLPTKEVIPDNIKLLNIDKEKQIQYGDKEVRKFAIDPMNQNENDRYSFQHFIYGFSTSLLNKLQNKNPKRVFQPYIEPGVRKNLSNPNKGFYFYSDKKFIDSYKAFCRNSEKLAFLRQHVEQARKVHVGGGNLLYFIIHGVAAREMLANVIATTKALNSNFAKIISIAEERIAENKLQSKSNENKKWAATYAKVLANKLDVTFTKNIGEMKEISEKLNALHEYFEENPELRREEIAGDAAAFQENVSVIKDNLQPQKLQMRQSQSERKEDVEEIVESKSAEAIQSIIQETSIIPSKLIKSSSLEILWDFYQISAQSLRKTLSDLNKQFPLNVKDYAKAERGLIEMYHGNVKPKSKKQTFKDCQTLYFKLDNDLARIKSIDNDFVALIFLFRFELAHRQAKHIAIILDQEICSAQEMEGSIRRFNEKCLTDITNCRGLTVEEREYKNALSNMVFYLSKMIGGDTSYFLKRKIMDEAQSFSCSSAIKPYRVRAHRPSFFQQDALPLAPLQFELKHDDNDPVSIVDDHPLAIPVFSDLKKAKDEPQDKPELDKVEYNADVRLELKEKDDQVVLNELNYFCYEALKASHSQATAEYNGYNFWWGYSKEDNIKRHKRHHEHYEQLLQCAARLTNGEICTVVKGSIEEIPAITEEKLLRWIENIVREEKKYYTQYGLYYTLGKFIEKRNNNKLTLLKKEKDDKDNELKRSAEDAAKKSEESAQRIKELLEKSEKSDAAAKKSAENAQAKEAEIQAKAAEVQAKDKQINEQSEVIRKLQRDLLLLKPKAVEKDKTHEQKQPQYKPMHFKR